LPIQSGLVFDSLHGSQKSFRGIPVVAEPILGNRFIREISLVDGPVGKRGNVPGFDIGKIPGLPATGKIQEELVPQLVDMDLPTHFRPTGPGSPVFEGPVSPGGDPTGDEDPLEGTLGAEPIQLIGIHPPSLPLEQMFRVVETPLGGFSKVISWCHTGHMRPLFEV